MARGNIDDVQQTASGVRDEEESTKTCPCRICFEAAAAAADDMHTVERCTHRFCACRQQHVKRIKEWTHAGFLPFCPRAGCATQLTIDGSRALLASSPNLPRIMAKRVKEWTIPPEQRIYCPYVECSSLMSAKELKAPPSPSSSSWWWRRDGAWELIYSSIRRKVIETLRRRRRRSSSTDAAATTPRSTTLRKCATCRGPFCVTCRVPWHEGKDCAEYARTRPPRPHPDEEDKLLHILKREQIWCYCPRCKHLIELEYGCTLITRV